MKFNVTKIQEKIQPVVNKISNNVYLKSLMTGMMATIPATIIGAIASLLKTLPIEAYQTFITNNGIDKFLQIPINLTTGMIALLIVFATSNALAEHFELKGISVSLVALISFLMVTPLQSSVNDWGMVESSIPMNWLGAQGVFSALLVAFVVTRLYAFISNKGWTIKMPESVPPFIKDSFSSLIPGIIISTVFLLVAVLFTFTPFGNIHQFIYGVIQIPLQNIGGSFSALIVVSLIAQVLWVFGIHGSMVTLSVVMPIWMAMDAAQLMAFTNGQPLPNVVGMTFFNIYTFGGTVLGLTILMLKAKSERFKMIGKVGIVPAIFGITEPIIFGAPLILNPIFAIPFIFGNIVSLIIAYGATVMGIIPRLSGIGAPSGTPVVIQGLIAGGWQVALFQFVLVIIWMGLWYPFFKIADNNAYKEENQTTEIIA